MTYLRALGELVDARGAWPEAERLHRLFDCAFDHQMEESPESATILGHPGQNDRWTDWSLDAVARRREDAVATLEAAFSIDRDALDAGDALSYDVFVHLAADAARGAEHPDHLLPVTQLDGVQVDAAFVLGAMPTATPAQLDDVIARLRALPTWVDQSIALLREGVAAGITTPAVTLRDVPAQLAANLTADPLASPLLAPVRDLPPSIPAATRQRVVDDATAIYDQHVAPALRRLLEHLTDVYTPAARSSVALGDLPGGEAWYASRVRSSTTLDVGPEELHRTGLDEVARIEAEMAAVRTDTGFAGTAAEFAEWLRTDERFTFATGDELLASYRDIAKRVDATVLRLFRRLPLLPFAVVPVPAEQAPSAPAAFYLPGSLDDARPGQFFANTHDLPSRPRWNMESICLHEAVPGHHFQLTLAQELAELPRFRRHAFVTAYLEGWGLYCESLGPELGLYTDPYQRYGSLDAEILRAIRLVVDTGIHALGWSRERAIEYFTAHSASPVHEIVTEVDRYIVLPGQALAYKTGELALQSLRARAATELGDAFDVRGFHDELLRHGALPLDLLETVVGRWIAQQASAGPGGPAGAAS